jgi:hypothetical protein
MSEEMKICTGCGDSFPATREFFTTSRNKSGLSSECHTCLNARSRLKRLKRLGLVEEVPPIPKGDPHQKIRCIKCHRSYPATPEYFNLDDPERKHKERRGKECIKCKNHKQKIEETCAACGTNNGNLRGDININTGKRYGILCSKCYQLVAIAKEDAERVAQVARYLKRTRRPALVHRDETGRQGVTTESSITN